MSYAALLIDFHLFDRLSFISCLQCFDAVGWPVKTERWGAGVVICLE